MLEYQLTALEHKLATRIYAGQAFSRTSETLLQVSKYLLSNRTASPEV
jgi:hypothetical protein